MGSSPFTRTPNLFKIEDHEKFLPERRNLRLGRLLLLGRCEISSEVDTSDLPETESVRAPQGVRVGMEAMGAWRQRKAEAGPGSPERFTKSGQRIPRERRNHKVETRGQ